MGSLVNSVKPMAHTHSSFYQIRIHTLKKTSIETLRSLFPISQSTCQPTIGSHSEATSIIKAGVFTGAENWGKLFRFEGCCLLVRAAVSWARVSFWQGLSHIQRDTKPCSGCFSAPLQPHEQTHRQPSSDVTLTLHLMNRDNPGESLWYVRIGQRRPELMSPLPKLIHRMRVDWRQSPWRGAFSECLSEQSAAVWHGTRWVTQALAVVCHFGATLRMLCDIPEALSEEDTGWNHTHGPP